MNDYRLGNMVVEPADGGQWRISGLFDLMECRFGDGENDIVRMVYNYLKEAKVGGREPARASVQAQSPLCVHVPPGDGRPNLAVCLAYILDSYASHTQFVSRQ